MEALQRVYKVSTFLSCERKVRQQGTNLSYKCTLWSVRGGDANVNLTKAILGRASAVIVVIGR